MRSMKLFVAALVLAFTAFGQPAAADPIYVDGIVAMVGTEIITWSELEEAEASLRADPSFVEDENTSIKKEVLDRMIEDLLINQAAARESIFVSQAEVDRSIEGWLKQNQITMDVLKKELEREGLSWEQYQANFKKHLTQSKFIDIIIRPKVSVTDAQISAYYAREVSTVKKEQVADIWLIFLAYGPDTSPERQAEVLARANALKASIDDGSTDFGNAAETMSDDPSSTEGGYLGSFRRGELFPELDKAVFGAKSEEDVLGPLVTDTGVFVVKAKLGQISDTVSLEEARPQIEGILYQQELERQLTLWVEEAKRSEHIEILMSEDRL